MNETINTYWLDSRETVWFVDPRLLILLHSEFCKRKNYHKLMKYVSSIKRFNIVAVQPVKQQEQN